MIFSIEKKPQAFENQLLNVKKMYLCKKLRLK